MGGLSEYGDIPKLIYMIASKGNFSFVLNDVYALNFSIISQQLIFPRLNIGAI